MSDHPAAAATRRIVAWITGNVPELADALAPPVTAAELAGLEAAINTPAVRGLTAAMLLDHPGGEVPGEPDPAGPSFGRPLPADLAAVFTVCGGRGDHGVLPSLSDDPFCGVLPLYPPGRIVADYRCQRDLLAVGEFDDATPEDTDPGVRETWWDCRWLPVSGDGGGNLICLDYAPADGGTAGQVIDHDHEVGFHTILFPSLTAWLEYAAHQLEANRFSFDPYEEQLMAVEIG